MAILQTTYCRSNRDFFSNKKNLLGLTLIEVLIALAIISIAITAVIKATTQNIRATNHLQNKTVATWVGQEVMNEVRADIIRLPDPPDKLKRTSSMLGRDWYWEVGKFATPNKQIKKIEVNVFTHKIDDENETPLVSLEGYVYHEAQ